MKKLFGTDGVRGIAGVDLTAELAYKIGLCAANLFTGKNKKSRVLIGKDTRVSGDMLEAAISAGLAAGGADAVSIGVVPTPAVAFIVTKHSFDAGIMISASHNTAEYNGIKIFGADGFKLTDDEELNIENHIENIGKIPLASGGAVGRIYSEPSLIEGYIDQLKGLIPETALRPLRIIIDCANGSAAATADKIFISNQNLTYDFINREPDGLNINEGCGSTHMDGLRKKVIAGGYDTGIAFDGDADRCLMLDEKGGDIEGDHIIAMLADDMKKRGALKKNTTVVTIMSNLGLHKFAGEKGIEIKQTDVGDRYVLEAMLEGGYNLGGENSGHIILTDYAATGDGQLTAVMMLSLLAKNKELASVLASKLQTIPQIIQNVRITAEKRALIMSSPELATAIESVKSRLGRFERINVRPSGTEPLIRVMVEGDDRDKIQAYALEIEKVITGL